jgi:hypothetical protein
MKKLLRVVALGAGCGLSLLPSARAEDSTEAAVPDAIKTITAREIGGHLRFLASDLMKGRDTASNEIRLAGEYLAGHLYAAGAQPLTDSGPEGGSFFRSFPLEVITPQEKGTELELIFERGGSRRVIPCQFGRDFHFFPYGVAPGEIEADVVFAGQGRIDAGKGIDDFKGLNVKDRFVLLFSESSSPRAGREGARENGSLGLLVMPPPGQQTTPRPQGLSGRDVSFGRSRTSLGQEPSSPPVLRLSDEVRDQLVEMLGLSAESKPHELNDAKLRVRFRFAANREVRADRNVLGYFPGSDPEKKKEIVIFSAHYDHVGVNDQGEIFNGSDDNASGTSTLLEIAEAFGQGPRPARSVAFLWVSGEEKGLLGSRWFSEHLNLPADHKIVADINLDMVSRNDPKKVGITPSPRHDSYNSLVPAAQDACKAEGMEVVFDADQYFLRTDSANFARKGIPVIFFFSGIHADYHRPTDDIEKADTEKAARIARSAYRLGWQVAQASEAPRKLERAPKEASREKPSPTASAR